MLMSLSFNITNKLASISPALFSASKAIPAVIAPSPIIATLRRSKFASFAAIAIPNAAEIDVLE